MQSDQPQPQIAPDPNLAAEQAQAQKTLIDNLQAQAQGDTASLMARYGTRLALAGQAPSNAVSLIPSGRGF
jgi:hypothetical protein